jgi:hypothetical protein
LNIADAHRHNGHGVRVALRTGREELPAHVCIQSGGAGVTRLATSVLIVWGLEQEAENLYKLTQGQTPLLGGENPSLHASDFSGVTPKAKVAATPNPLRTPLHGGIEGGATPRGGGATPSTVGTMTPRGGTLPYSDAKVANRDSSRFGTARQRMVLERWTNPKRQRRTRSSRYEVPSCRGKPAGVA